MTKIEKAFLTREEAGAMLGVSARTVDMLLDEGRLATVQIGRRKRIPVESVAQYLSAQPEAKGGDE